MKKKYLLFILSLFLIGKNFAATVDTIVIPSKIMHKEYKAVIVLPASYATNHKNYPVLYLLHGGYGHFDDWIKKTSDTKLIQKIADQYNFIVVMPEGEIFSYYIDSPVSVPIQLPIEISEKI